MGATILGGTQLYAGGRTWQVSTSSILSTTEYQEHENRLVFVDYLHLHIFNMHYIIDPPISTEHCDWLYGIFGHETSCTRYWTCWNGTATEQFCIGGLLYNEETHACDWPQNVGGCQKHREYYARYFSNSLALIPL